MAFASLRNRTEELYIKMDQTGRLQLICDNMELCGDIIQNLVEYLALEDLASVCDFPVEMETIEKLLQAADDLQRVRLRLAAEMADHSGIIRTLVVRAEDSRLLGDMYGSENLKCR